MKRFLITIFSILTIAGAQSTWMFSGRVHPELKWQTISTKHFNIHYHQGIDEIAKEGAVIAEHVRPTLLTQMDLDTIPKIDIIFTSEDEIMNGFALWTYQTFIWVDQNDAAIWLEKGKWLEQVLSHELQHIVLLHKIKSWMPEPWGNLFSGMPGWVVEGTAEYETESWRPYRADLSHKIHILKNKTDKMDPHHDGFSKMLYWADRFGDSTITKTLAYRNNIKLFDFDSGFKKATGITVDQFNEDWRRHMNTYYYGFRSQKESYKEIGDIISLPIKKLQSFHFFDDSSKIVLIGKDDKDQFDTSFIIAKRDTAKEIKQFEKWEKRIEKLEKKKKKSKKDSLTINKPFKEKVLWKKEEVDYGRFHNSLSWSSNGKKIAYAKYHFGENQSMVFDIKYYDTEAEKYHWLTHSMRATYPVWLDSNTVAFVAHQNNVSNIYKVKIGGDTPIPITHYKENTQIAFLSVSPNGENIAFSMSPKNANLDMYNLHIQSGNVERLTDDSMADISPVWHPDGTAISYTSNASGVPNIYTINLSTGKITPNSDAGDGIWTHQWMPKDSLLLALSLADVDSIRLVKVNPFRKPDTEPISLRNNYTRWLKSGPDVSFVNEKKLPPKVSKSQKYNFTKHMRHLTSLIIPTLNPFGMTIWTDAMGRHTFQAIGFMNQRNLRESGYALSYTNAQHGPLWSISMTKNIDGAFRFYDGAKLIDIKNGISLTASHPLSLGEPASNHQFTAGASFINHLVTVGTKTNKKTGELIPRDTSDYINLPIPDNGKDGFLSLSYLWTKKRPHAWNGLHPTQGYGVYTQLDYATKSIFGNFSYSRLTTDAYINLPVGKTALYFRLKTVIQSGQPPKQDYVGLTDDAPIYIGGNQILLNRFLPENHNLRGWSGHRLGNRLIFGSLEYRLPIAPKVLSFNLISDYGNAWTHNEDKEEMMISAGYEIRLSLGPFILSGGKAQLFDDWESGKKPIQYFRLVLTNPF
ncbi:MAG: PD40 domain-containing protein [Candidatus Marinimicrobia bacterium]|nr:PD40 domain-containing protein [Candidatus Neomarinimicrobiota bacterium]MBL7031048.1 PD40 domain-containing protein [Candidatus Neomarinimicrobiota bacterium]